MVALPKRPETLITERIYVGIEKEKRDPATYLGRLGASSVGEECVRAIWLSWRAYAREEFSGRMLRLFETGHLQEDRVVADLRRAGLAVWDRDEQTGRQYEFTDPSGHLIAKLDGVVRGVPEHEDIPHVLEVKTHNKSSFNSLQKKGVREAKPVHYAQMQTGMWLGGFEWALYVALCKDDESYHVERVARDPETVERLQRRVESLRSARLRPAGISDDGKSFGCKFCSVRAQCLREAPALRTCRSCRHCEPGPAGVWVCGVSRATLSQRAQLEACEHYEEL